ncbi:MAG: hypothetical protein PHX83_10830 [Acidobacteriia bacterium]|nr:hypothetical protein [Terriglobia bacterium]
MIARKLIELIERNADRMVTRLLATVAEHPRTQIFHKNVPPQELRERAYEIYKHLSVWLHEKTDDDIRHTFFSAGTRRAIQKVPLAEVHFALLLIKQSLWREIKLSGFGDTSIELFQTLELLERVDQFFDKAIYYLTAGFEHACSTGQADWKADTDKEHAQFKELQHLVLPWWP